MASFEPDLKLGGFCLSVFLQVGLEGQSSRDKHDKLRNAAKKLVILQAYRNTYRMEGRKLFFLLRAHSESLLAGLGEPTMWGPGKCTWVRACQSSIVPAVLTALTL